MMKNDNAKIQHCGLTGVLALVLVGLAQSAQAVPFSASDMDALSMGGAGVAAAVDNGSQTNPALTVSHMRKPAEFMQYFSGHLMMGNQDALDTGLKDFQSVATTPGAATASQLQALAGKTQRWDYSANIGTVMLAKETATSVVLKAYSFQRADVRVAQSDVDTLNSNQIPDGYQSTLQQRGVSVVEAGVSFASRVNVKTRGLGELMVAYTPKYVLAKIHGTDEPVDSRDISLVNAGGDNKSQFNFDIGVAKEFGRLWSVGAVAKNLLPMYLGEGNNRARLGPQLRVGGAVRPRWGTIAADLDVLPNEGIGKVIDMSQLLAMGVALPISENTSFRMGYSHDLRGGLEDRLSLGVGTQGLFFRTEILVIRQDSGVGGGLQLGLIF